MLSQRDPRWSQTKLGQSSLTIGRYGCTTTCISMLTSYFGIWQSPIEIATAPGNYTADGLVLWPNISSMLKSMKFDKRIQGRNDAEIMASLKDPNKAVILQVDNGQHWVVAIKKTLFGNDYVIYDPWFGDKRTACGSYKNITGSAHWVKK